MAKRKRETDEQGNELALPALERLPVLESDEDLQAGVMELAQLKQARKKAEADEEQKEQQILDSLFARGIVDAYEIDGVAKVAIQSKVTRTLQREVLIARGVDPEIVVAATHTSYSDPFIRLYPKAGK